MSDVNDKLQNGPIIDVTPEDIEHKDRITCRFEVVHEHYGDTPHPVSCAFSHMLKTVGAPWRRPIEVTQGTPFTFADSGMWVKDPGMIVIENRAGKASQVHLSNEKKVELAKQILQVNLKGTLTSIIIRPGRFAAFELDDLEAVVITSQYGVIPVTINILPE